MRVLSLGQVMKRLNHRRTTVGSNTTIALPVHVSQGHHEYLVIRMLQATLHNLGVTVLIHPRCAAAELPEGHDQSQNGLCCNFEHTHSCKSWSDGILYIIVYSVVRDVF